MNTESLILSLYKQHYMDFYPDDSLKCQFSTWGYFDGMSFIECPEKNQSTLFEKKSKSQISNIWYTLKDQISVQNGLSSVQNIGIFRFYSVNDDPDDQWEKLPYIAVVFIQLKNRLEYETVENKIKWIPSPPINVTRMVRIYKTYDNADLIVIMKSNRLSALDAVIRKIATYEEITYQHSVTGVDERLLTAVSGLDSLLSFQYKGFNCFLEDIIPSVQLELVHNGDSDFLRYLKKILREFINDPVLNIQLKDIVHAPHLGHSNDIVTIPDINVYTILKLISDQKPANHHGPLYKLKLYNMETTFIQEKAESFDTVTEKDYKDLMQKNEESAKKTCKNWCRTQIEYFTEIQTPNNLSRLEEYLKEGDEHIFSYLLTLIQTLNVLSQYERFSISSDIFYMIYPAFQMFLSQLKKRLEFLKNNKDQEDYAQNVENTLDAMNKFLKIVSTILQHVVHTSQTFLMVPGVGGTPYDISIKLSLLYYWVTGKLFDILNDKPNKYQYNCILYPVVEANPCTYVISADHKDRDRLICIEVSQRTMFLPRHLIIILSHEIGHYVGDNCRKRDERAHAIICSAAAYFSLIVFPEELEVLLSEEEKKNLTMEREKLVETVSEWIQKKFLEKAERDFYAEETKRSIIRCFSSILNNIDTEFPQITMFYSGLKISRLKNHSGNSLQQKEEIESISRIENIVSRDIRFNKTYLDISGYVEELFLYYKEVYADIVSRCVLNYSVDEFCENLQASGGTKIKENNKLKEMSVREYFLEKIWKKKPDDSIYNEAEKALVTEYAMKRLEEYGIECKKNIMKHLRKSRKQVTDLEKIYEIFTNDQMEPDEIYKKIIERNEEYVNRVKGILDNI